jgi:hypothetical protein
MELMLKSADTTSKRAYEQKESSSSAAEAAATTEEWSKWIAPHIDLGSGGISDKLTEKSHE